MTAIHKRILGGIQTKDNGSGVDWLWMDFVEAKTPSRDQRDSGRFLLGKSNVFFHGTKQDSANVGAIHESPLRG